MKDLDAVPQGLKGVNYLREELEENIISYVLPVNPRKLCKGWKSFLEILFLELLLIIFIFQALCYMYYSNIVYKFTV